MPIHRLLAVSALALALGFSSAPPASAQTDPPSRAARDADNPMRLIIEASKLKVRIKPDGPEPAPAEKRPAPAAKPVTAVAVVKKAASAPGPSAAASQASLAAAPAVEVAAEPPPALAVTKLPEAGASVAALAAATSLASAPPPLKLMHLVEPSLSSAVVRRMRSDVEVVVGFTVNADGTVSDAVIRSNPMKALDAAVLEAVAQWRYAPIGEARSHAVQLVLRASL